MGKIEGKFNARKIDWCAVTGSKVIAFYILASYCRLCCSVLNARSSLAGSGMENLARKFIKDACFMLYGSLLRPFFTRLIFVCYLSYASDRVSHQLFFPCDL